MAVEKYFDMQSTQEDWDQLGTIEQIADFVALNRGVKKPRKPPAFWARLLGPRNTP